jgi:hypothetical protein
MTKKLTRELIAQKVKSDRIESIRNLNLWGSNIEDISIIEEMPSLEVVSLSVNKIRTLRPFANLDNLRELYLRRNLISNLNEIKYLTECQNLSVLWLSENPICDNPNYRSVVICVLPQLQKLDDITITDEERDRAQKKLRGESQDDDDEDEMEDNNNIRDNGDNYYEKNGRANMNRNNNNNRNKYEDDDNDYMRPKKENQQMRRQNEEYNNYDDRPIRSNNDIYGRKNNYKKNNNYGDNYQYKDNYDDNNYKDKKKGNSNVLNCVISLLKELSPNELKMVKKEIDRMNNY